MLWAKIYAWLAVGVSEARGQPTGYRSDPVATGNNLVQRSLIINPCQYRVAPRMCPDIESTTN
jgi:hypothetical protein